MTALLQIACQKVIQSPRIAPRPLDLLIEELKHCEQPELPVTHRFSPGVYLREFFVPAGTVVVGHVHRMKCQNIMLTGRAIVAIDGVSTELVAPFIFESDAGSQKAAHITENMRWITVHPNPDNLTDIVEIERMIFDLPEEIIAAGIPLDDFRMNRNLKLKEAQ